MGPVSFRRAIQFNVIVIAHQDCAWTFAVKSSTFKPVRRLVSVALLSLMLTPFSRGQFVPTLLQNRSYWGDGKSEIDFYQADFNRDGETHQCELVMILTPVFVDPKTLAYLEDSKPSGAIPAIRMSEMATIPRGLAAEQQAIEALWRMDSMSLAKLSFVGDDLRGNSAKILRENRDATTVTWSYSCDSYSGRVDSQPVSIGTKPVLAYDELPIRVRTLDFSKPAGEVEVDLVSTLASSGKELGEPRPAKISWKSTERSIDVELQHATGRDHFVIDSNFPFLLREWQTSDGTRWKMKNSIRADYRRYLRNGDRERAWKDPMFRHPD
jgi:hypothetical protein